MVYLTEFRNLLWQWISGICFDPSDPYQSPVGAEQDAQKCCCVIEPWCELFYHGKGSFSKFQVISVFFLIMVAEMHLFKLLLLKLMKRLALTKCHWFWHWHGFWLHISESELADNIKWCRKLAEKAGVPVYWTVQPDPKWEFYKTKNFFTGLVLLISISMYVNIEYLQVSDRNWAIGDRKLQIADRIRVIADTFWCRRWRFIHLKCSLSQPLCAFNRRWSASA
jgi:hypothetical protein